MATSRSLDPRRLRRMAVGGHAYVGNAEEYGRPPARECRPRRETRVLPRPRPDLLQGPMGQSCLISNLSMIHCNFNVVPPMLDYQLENVQFLPSSKSAKSSKRRKITESPCARSCLLILANYSIDSSEPIPSLLASSNHITKGNFMEF